MGKQADSIKKLDTYFDSLPQRLEPIISFQRPNIIIPIYNGTVKVTCEYSCVECNVNIFFTWLPRRCVEFTIVDNGSEVDKLFCHYMDHSANINFEIPGYQFGKVLCTNIRENTNGSIINGLINPPVLHYTNNLIHDTVDQVKFHLFNYIYIHGSPVKKANRRGSILARMVFPMHNYEIIVDSIVNNPTHWNEICQQGGYGLTHVSELRSKNNDVINRDVADNIFDQFNLFMSFLAGRKVAAFFKTGTKDDAIVWLEYNYYKQEPYTFLPSWVPQMFDEKIGAIWNSFHTLCQDDYNLESLHLVIHWYFSANKAAGGLEGAIILLQNAFELLFRWIAVELENILSADGSDSLRASDKIRMLLYLIKCSPDLPTHYQQEFTDLIKKDRSLIDFPYLFTEIRNSYVHSNRKKRDKINRLPSAYLEAILTCGIYYVELLILYLLEYDGKIAQRISPNKRRGSNEVIVPWVELDKA